MLTTFDEGMPRLQRMCRASSSFKCLHTESVQTLCRRRWRHSPCFTSLQSTDSEIHSSPPSFILCPLACSSLPYWDGAQLTCRPISSFIHFSLSVPPVLVQAKCSPWPDMISSPSYPAMIITHFCSAEPSFTWTFKLISPTNRLH